MDLSPPGAVRPKSRVPHVVDRLGLVLESALFGMILLDAEGGIIGGNAAFARMSGYSTEELRLRLVQRSRIEPGFDPRRQAAGEVEYRRKDGTSWWGLTDTVRLYAQESVIFVVDVTEYRQSRGLLQEARDRLDEQVVERTAEMETVNGALRDEILERRRGEKLRDSLVGQLVEAQEEERRRISRELHDVVGQHLTALILGLKRLAAPGEIAAPEAVADLQRLSEAIGKEIHDLAVELRPTSLDDLGLKRTLANHISRWSARSGIEAEFHAEKWKGGDTSSPVETTLYRIVCEALTNVMKHSGARSVSVILERKPGQAIAIIEDDGRGFDPENSRGKPLRLGITGMRERAALLGGEVKIEAGAGTGTTIFVRIPLR